MRARLVGIGVFLAAALAVLGPVRSYDIGWHLAAGRWIAEHRAVPRVDPFAVASDRIPWIDGSWLYQLIAYGVHALGGFALLSIVHALFVATLFAVVYRKSNGALLLVAIAYAGALPTLGVRPSAIAALLLVLTISAKTPLHHAVLAAVWINVHPSALLAPVVALVMTRSPKSTVASALALFANPYGWRAIAAPVELLLLVRGGEFVNREWLPSSPLAFPLLYVAILIGLAIRDRTLALFALLAWLAVSHARNQSLFFAAFPLLVAPFWKAQIRPAITWAACALALVHAATRTQHFIGLDPTRFPIRAVAELERRGVRGTIYNADQFGGYLIWTFYPERRVLTDGRNELHRTFIRELGAARRDERKWRALLEKYDVRVAVEEPLPPLEVKDARSGRVQRVEASLAYFPPSEWTLIAKDDVAMVFVRRESGAR